MTNLVYLRAIWCCCAFQLLYLEVLKLYQEPLLAFLDDDIIRTRPHYHAINKVFQMRHGSCNAGLIIYNNSVKPNKVFVTSRIYIRLSTTDIGPYQRMSRAYPHQENIQPTRSRKMAKRAGAWLRVCQKMNTLVHCRSNVACLYVRPALKKR